MMKIPTIGWIVIIIAAVAGIVGLWVGGFWAVTHVQWIGSAIALAIGIFWFRMDTSELKSSEPLVKAMMIVIFATIALALDQPGNPVYNKPIELIYCPRGTMLEHDVERSSARGGGVRVSQRFRCLDPNGVGEPREIGMFEYLAVRLGEYLALGYVLLSVSGLIRRIRSKKGEQ